MAATAMLSPNGQQTTEGDGPATRLLVATVKGVLVFERPSPGARWAEARQSLTDQHVGALVFEPGSGKLFAGAHGDGGVWISDDGAATHWRHSVKGLSRPHVYSLAARRADNAVTLFAGVEPASLFRSDDLGESWRELPALRNVPGTEKWTFPPPPHIAHVKCITPHPSRPGTLYACVEQGALLKSEDDGESWIELDGYVMADDATYRDTHRLEIDPTDHDILHLTTGCGLNRSRDGGKTWTPLTRRGERLDYPDFVAIDPRDHDILYVAGAATTPTQWHVDHVANPAVLKSVDAGRNWRELGNGLPHPMIGSIEAMSTHHWPGGMMLTIATATGEIYASENAGESWTCIIDGLAPISKAGHYRAFAPRGAKAPAAAAASA